MPRGRRIKLVQKTGCPRCRQEKLMDVDGWKAPPMCPKCWSEISKEDRAYFTAIYAAEPFTVNDLAYTVGCSLPTAYRAINQTHIVYAWRPKGSVFFRLFFPRNWSTNKIRSYLNEGHARGKSEAHIWQLQGGRRDAIHIANAQN